MQLSILIMSKSGTQNSIARSHILLSIMNFQPYNADLLFPSEGELSSLSLRNNLLPSLFLGDHSAGEARAIDASGAEKLEPSQLIYKPNYGESTKLKAIFTLESNVKEVVVQ
jgi:hypothetical protein